MDFGAASWRTRLGCASRWLADLVFFCFLYELFLYLHFVASITIVSIIYVIYLLYVLDCAKVGPQSKAVAWQLTVHVWMDHVSADLGKIFDKSRRRWGAKGVDLFKRVASRVTTRMYPA